MNNQRFCTSTCRLCSYYQPEGRRGGLCAQLGVPVKGCWKACSLAVQPFAHTNWTPLGEDIALLEQSLALPNHYGKPGELKPLEPIRDEFFPDSHPHREETLIS
ncbi:hypothetical protein K4A83_01060 [Spirulina subsalsa FACHB-351]|uniref:Uncharacterized protein n=1 Tax=Spirulina subsalsa FACHB-351 TaxID=234711 RepID=A0ABT3L040_9CYAN|nr:hypothetical protein [Spirulina subsalsa]MCW6034866.1 hypothetical protein [Spirulina subsalsa FACHB-351]